MLPDGSHRRSFTITSPTQDRDLSFQVTTGSLLGQVLGPDGVTPMANLRVMLVAGDQVVDTEFTSSEGFFAFPMAAPGTYDLVFDSIDHFFPRISGVVISGGTFVHAGEVVAGNLSLDVTIQSVNPPGGLFSLVPLNQPGVNARFFIFDETGVFTATGLVPGTYHVMASTGELAAIAQSVIEVVGDGGSLTVSMTQGALLSGTVTGPGGTPMEGLSIFVFDPLVPERQWTHLTDAQGHYELRVPDGDYVLVIADLQDDVSPGQLLAHAQFTDIAIVSGTPVVQDVTLAAGTATLSGTVNGSSVGAINTRPLGAILTLKTLDGIPVAIAFADAQGAFSFEHMVPGDYRLVTESPGFSYLPMHVTLAPGGNNANPGGHLACASRGFDRAACVHRWFSTRQHVRAFGCGRRFHVRTQRPDRPRRSWFGVRPPIQQSIHSVGTGHGTQVHL